MRHVPADHLGGETPPVFRCAEPGPDHAQFGLSPDCYWSTNGEQFAWYRTLSNPPSVWLRWEQSTAGQETAGRRPWWRRAKRR